MPVYVYQCEGCRSQVEKRQSFSDAPLTKCEACGGALRRVLQPPAIVFKGSGFYSTDNRSSSGNGSAGTSSHDAKNGSEPAASSAPVEPKKETAGSAPSSE